MTDVHDKPAPGVTWGDGQLDPLDPPPRGWRLAVVALRLFGMAVVLVTGLAALLLLRLIERPLHGLHRPWTPWITQAVCRIVLAIMGLRLRIQGTRMTAPGIVVANHTSWLDIFVLNAVQRVYFVSKDDVRSWPGIGVLARATGTVFIKRDRREAQAQTKMLAERMQAGHRLLIFPEGTSSDGRRLLPFRPTLFAALSGADVPGISVQPLSVCYAAPQGKEPRFFGWWGTQGFGDSLIRVLGAVPQGTVTVIQHDPIPAEGLTRKQIAAQSADTIRGGMDRMGVLAAPDQAPDT